MELADGGRLDKVTSEKGEEGKLGEEGRISRRPKSDHEEFSNCQEVFMVSERKMKGNKTMGA